MKQGYSDICLTMPFKDCNIENTQATMNIFVLICLKFQADLKIGEKNRQNVFKFSDNCI